MKQHTIGNNATLSPTNNAPHLDFIPVKEITARYFTKPTFYKHVRSGLIKLYKVGGRSFVKSSEFHAAFQPVEITTAESLLQRPSKN